MAKTGAISRQLGWVGLLVGAVQVVSGVSVFVSAGPFAMGGAFGAVAFVLFGLWMLGVSVRLTLKRPAN